MLCSSALFVVTLCGLGCVTDGQQNEQEIPYPVIILPGLAGSQLMARLNRTSVKHVYCQKKSDWYRIWQNTASILPFAINCFIDNMK